MKIIYQGYMYETNESTKYIYILNEISKQIVNKILNIKNEYEAIESYSNNVIDAYEPDNEGSYKLNPDLVKDGGTNRVKKFIKNTDNDGNYSIPKEIDPNIIDEDERALYINLSDIISINVNDEVIKKIISNTKLALVTGRFKSGGWCILTKARSGVNKGKETDVNNCIRHQISYSSDNHALLVVPFYRLSKYSIKTIDYTKERLDTLRNGIAHELTHMYDKLSGQDMSEIVNDNGMLDVDTRYVSKKTELNAYMLNVFNIIESKLKGLLENPKSNRDELLSFMQDEDSFLRTVNDLSYMPYSDTIKHMITIAKNSNPKANEYITSKLKSYYQDLKSRYNNVLPM